MKKIVLDIDQNQEGVYTSGDACEQIRARKLNQNLSINTPKVSSYDLVDERFAIELSPDKQTLTIRGKSCRGLLFGIGKFLRRSMIGCEQSYQQ